MLFLRSRLLVRQGELEVGAGLETDGSSREEEEDSVKGCTRRIFRDPVDGWKEKRWGLFVFELGRAVFSSLTEVSRGKRAGEGAVVRGG